MAYLQVSVSLHGLQGVASEHLARIEKVIRDAYPELHQSDLEIEIQEHSSGLACDCKNSVDDEL